MTHLGLLQGHVRTAFVQAQLPAPLDEVWSFDRPWPWPRGWRRRNSVITLFIGPPRLGWFTF